MEDVVGGSAAVMIGLSKDTCLHFLSLRIPELLCFRTLPAGSDVYDAKHNTIVITEAMKRLVTVSEVEGCWNNLMRAIQRVFSMSKEWENAWRLVWTQLQEWKIKAERSYPLLKRGPVQLALLNMLVGRFIPGVTHAEVTEEDVRNQLKLFRINFNDGWLKDEYAALERIDTRDTVARMVRPRDLPADGGVDHDNKRARGQDAGEAAGKVAAGKGWCFNFLTVGGCDRGPSRCRFKHRSASALPQAEKEKMKADLVAKGKVPDAAKF